MEGSSPYHCDQIFINVRVATMDPAVGSGYALIEHAAVGIAEGRIAVLLPMKEFHSGGFSGRVSDCHGALITPGFIDCHTHLIYGGNRADDFVRRMQGMSYTDIARSGGGILSTVRATRALSEEELFLAARPRVLALAREGVTTVEIKSGYGLTAEDELKMLRVARRLGRELPVRVSATLLAAHTVPPEYLGRPDDYIAMICSELVPRVAAEGLADAIDVFCESIAFTVSQAERLFAAGSSHGLGLKIHAEQLSATGAAQLAAGFQAWSADHLEHLDELGLHALQRSGTVATLLPGASYFLKESQHPPVDLLRHYGVPMAVASDLNPGTSPFGSLRLMMNMACVLFGLHPDEALAAVTRNAARALGLAEELGTVTVGKQADLLVWEVTDPAQLSCEVGLNRPAQRIFKGEAVGA